MEFIGVTLIVVGAVLIALEMHALTVYLLAAAAVCIVGGVIALAGGSPHWVVSGMAMTAVAALPIARWARTRLKNRASDDVSQDDRGHRVTVLESSAGVLRVSYRGSTWNARLREPSGPAPRPGETLVIAAREGGTLVLDPPRSAI